MILAGLDIETTGLEMNQGHRLIQIGIAILDTDTGTYNEFSSDVKPIGKMLISDKALEVNGFTKKRINAARSQDTVDSILWNEIRHAGYSYRSVVPVGWNVINFDMPFIKRELPLVAMLFTYPTPDQSTRAVDLMSLGLFLSYRDGKPYDTIKKEVRAEAAKRLGENKEHDALYDAKAALEALKIYKELLGAL